MLAPEQIDELEEGGFVRVENYLDIDECKGLYDFMDQSHTYYNEENLRSKAAYPSDSSESRISNAFMVSTGNSPLPHIEPENSYVSSLVDDFHIMLGQLDDEEDFMEIMSTRSMLNMQKYFEESKEVPWHFDGEYFRSHPGTTKVIEGMIPQWVSVYTLFNENEYGTLLKDIETDEVTQLKSNSGDMVLFDNTRFLHAVPTLHKARSIVGLRNFDYKPWYYHSYCEGELVQHQCFNGRREKISTHAAECMHKSHTDRHTDDFDIKSLEAKF